jgi:putative endonuclease
MEYSNYYVYILTNKYKNVLYVGVTNDLPRRLYEHSIQKLRKKAFTFRYNCDFIVYYENYRNVEDAMSREIEIKKWRREKKNALIESSNPEWKFLNEEVMAF